MSAAIAPRVLDLPMHELAGSADSPVILALGGISAGRHVVSHAADRRAGWWEGLAGTGRLLDTGLRRVLGIEFLDGGRGEDGRPAAIVTTHDQAAAVIALLDALCIDRLHAVVGASYGGMVALALGERWPDRVGRIVAISAPHASSAMATALRTSQRRVVELGLETGRPTDGMVIARGIAMTSYRTAREFDERFVAAPVVCGRDASFEVEGYLRHAGARFAERMTPARFLALSLSADLHRVEPERIAVPTTVVAAQGDTLVPSSQLRVLARRLPRLAGFLTLRTRFGHDAFLTESARLGRLLTAALATAP